MERWIKQPKRIREPLYPEFEEELRKELETILIENYKADHITTRFDYNNIK